MQQTLVRAEQRPGVEAEPRNWCWRRPENEGGRTAEPALSDVAVDASRVAGVAQIRQPEGRERTHVHGHVVS